MGMEFRDPMMPEKSTVDRATCPLTLACFYEERISHNFSTALGTPCCRARVRVRITNNAAAGSSPYAFVFEALCGDVDFDNEETQSPNRSGPLCWAGQSKIIVSQNGGLSPGASIDASLCLLLFYPGVYNINRFRCTPYAKKRGKALSVRKSNEPFMFTTEEFLLRCDDTSKCQ